MDTIRRRGYLVAAVVCSALVALAIHATRDTTTRVEAESLAAPSECWAPMSSSSLSGGKGRKCHNATDTSLTWAISVPNGQSRVVRMYGFRDGVERGFRVSVDDGAWVTGSLRGEPSGSTVFFTSVPLPGGRHTFALEWVDSPGQFTFDYYELETTSAPTSTTTSDLRPSDVCRVDPADNHLDISAAISDCPVGVVLFPADREYHITDAIRLDDLADRVIDGNGSAFIKTRATPGGEKHPNWLLVRPQEVTLRNMVIRGTYAGAGRGGLPSANQFDHGIAIRGGRDVTVADVEIYNVYGDFVAIDPSGPIEGGGFLDGQKPVNIRIHRLTGKRAAREGVFVSAVTGFWLTDSELTDCDQSCFDAESDHPANPLKDGHILRNTIDGHRFSAITVPDPGISGAVEGWEIRGNEVLTMADTCFPPIYVGYRNPDRGTFADITIVDNILTARGNGIHLVDVDSGTIRGNRITNPVGPFRCGSGNAPAEPLRIENSPNVVVASNVAEGYE